jgi:hypothetical protein
MRVNDEIDCFVSMAQINTCPQIDFSRTLFGSDFKSFMTLT